MLYHTSNGTYALMGAAIWVAVRQEPQRVVAAAR